MWLQRLTRCGGISQLHAPLARTICTDTGTVLACTIHTDTSMRSLHAPLKCAPCMHPWMYFWHATLACNPCMHLAGNPCMHLADRHKHFIGTPTHTDTGIRSCSQDVPWVEGKLQEVVGIIPDLSGKIDRMKANIIVQLVTETQVSLHVTVYCSFHQPTCLIPAVSPQAVAQQVLDLRTLLPHVDVSRMLAQHPDLIFKLEPGKVSQQLHLLRQALVHHQVQSSSTYQ